MWLLNSECVAAISGATFSLEQHTAHASAMGSVTSLARVGYREEGATAYFSIDGVITARPDFFALLFGGGNILYSDIDAAVTQANQSGPVSKIVMEVGNCPGGTVDGLFDTLATLQSSKKPIEAVVSSQAASAGFAIVSQAQKITATNPAVRFGSIGVAVDARVDKGVISITNSASPLKRPDITTEAGRESIVSHLDDLHELFSGAIASGRGVTPAEVDAKFGAGAMLLAAAAKEAGMIDGYATRLQKPATPGGGITQETKSMDLSELKAQHPAVYEAAIAMGVEQGVQQERERVLCHLTMAVPAGAVDQAVKAIKEGESYTLLTQAEYQAQALSASDRSRMAGDEEHSGAGDGADDGGEGEGGASEAVIAAVENSVGIGGDVL